MSLMTFYSCERCAKRTLTIEEITKIDKEIMASERDSFVWYETIVHLDSYLDEANNNSYDSVVNIFKAIKNGQPMIHRFFHLKGNVNYRDSIPGFWVEDCPLIDSLLKVPYDSAYMYMTRVNLPKPHSKNAILRCPLGPKDCNPQWVFGNIDSQIWVDATDGTVRESDPSFPE